MEQIASSWNNKQEKYTKTATGDKVTLTDFSRPFSCISECLYYGL